MDEQGLPARVREWINTSAGRTVVSVAVGAAILLAVVVAIASRTSTQKEADKIRGRGVKVLYVCKACGASGETRKGFDEPFPIECPKCGEKKAVAGFRCTHCRKIIEAADDLVFECKYCKHVYDQRLDR